MLPSQSPLPRPVTGARGHHRRSPPVPQASGMALFLRKHRSNVPVAQNGPELQETGIDGSIWRRPLLKDKPLKEKK